MKKIITLGFIGIISILSMNCTRIGVGSVGIKVSMAGSSRGVQDITIKTGWAFYNPLASSVYEYPTYVQTAVWTKNEKEGNESNEEISFNSKDGMIFTADINLSYRLDANKVPQFYVKYKSDDISTFTHGMLRQVARDEFNNVAATYTAEEIYGVKKEEFTQNVRKRLNDSFKEVGMTIETLGFIGAPRPPASFTNAINAKLAAVQNAQKAVNELQTAEAEAKKVVAKAEGEAKANEILTKSLSQQLIAWKQLDIQKDALEKWNGALPNYVSGNATTPFVDISKLKQ